MMTISTPPTSAKSARRGWIALPLTLISVATLAVISLSIGSTAQAQTQSPTCPNPYTVQVKDSLVKIAAADSVDWTTLQSLNGIINPNLIFVGQVLCLPNPLPTPTAQPTATGTPGVTITATDSLLTSTPQATVVPATPTIVPTTVIPATAMPIVYPSIGFDRGLALQGETITVTGINFPANSTLQIYYKLLISPDAYVPIAQTTASDTGTINFTMTVPGSYEGNSLLGAVSILVRDPISGYYGYSFFYARAAAS